MRKNPCYAIKEIGGDYYLLPFGQEIENGARAVRVNGVAAFLWEELDAQQDIKVLVEKLAEEYEVAPDELGLVEADIREMLRKFRRMGILLDADWEILKSTLNIRNKRSELKKIRMAHPAVPERREKIGIGAGERENRADGKSVIFDADTMYSKTADKVERMLEIADIKILFQGKEEHFSDNFLPFCVDTNRDELSCNVINEGGRFPGIIVIEKEDAPPKVEEMPLVLQGLVVSVYDDGDYYVMQSEVTPGLTALCIRKDGDRGELYVDAGEAARWTGWSIVRPYGKTVDAIPVQSLTESVFHAVRHIFLIRAQREGMYVIHSASILHDGKAWLFSGLSGTGKSTHTKLWHKLYGTPYLNGDLNLLAFEKGRPVIKGIPWCGTSGIFSTDAYPLGGVILLEQDTKNYIEELTFSAQVLGIMMRFISPKWDVRQASESVDFAERVVKTARIARLHCNMEDEAARVCREWIDRGGYDGQ